MILKKTKLGLTFDILEVYKVFVNIYKLFLFIPILFIMACSASYEEVKKINLGEPKTFQEHLFYNYQQKANFEAKEMHDWNSAKLYSEKALRAQKGENIYPEKISYWKLPSDRVKDIKVGYFNLLNIYDEAKAADPLNLAIAISSLDCWSEQQEENWQTWDINKCKDDFLKSMHFIYDNIASKQKANEDKNKKIQETKTNNNNDATLVTKNKNKEVMQIIYFDFDKYALSNVSISKIKTFLNKNGNNIENYIIIGHTDTKGSKYYNQKLSLKRADTVKNILISEGILETKIKILGKGEESLAVITPDEIRHPANRRAEIKKLN